MPQPSDKHLSCAGIYIHVPFCVAKCPYCDFYSITNLDPIPDYLAALHLEIDRCESVLPMFDTIYFGGGTPSTLAPRHVGRILEHLGKRFSLATSAEITLEMNPGTVDPQKLSGFRFAGINRLNIGLQSLDEDTLRLLGRVHDARQGRESFEWARQYGFDNIGIDFIYGVPGQTQKQWERDLSGAVDLGAEHLSCYTLTLEPGTMMSEKINSGKMPPPDEALTGDLFSFTGDFLDCNGYFQYEISNHARTPEADTIDYRSRHNCKYWNFAPYLGFGPAAHSFMDNRRWWNRPSLGDYLNAIQNGLSPVAETETLTREQQIIEFIYLGLRQAVGIDTQEYRLRFDDDFCTRHDEALCSLAAEGLIERTPPRVRATARGMRFLDRVVDRLIG